MEAVMDKASQQRFKVGDRVARRQFPKQTGTIDRIEPGKDNKGRMKVGYHIQEDSDTADGVRSDASSRYLDEELISARKSLDQRRSIHKQLGDLAQAVAKRLPRDAVCKTALGTVPGAQGGYLVPQELMLGIDSYLQEYGLIHRMATQCPMVADQCDFGAFDLTVAGATGQSPLYGGLTLSWGTQNSTLPEDEPAFAGGTLVSKNLQCNCYVSKQMVDDGGEALGAYLENGFARAMEFGVEYACFNGIGVGMPLGIVQAPATKQVTRTGAGHITSADLGKMAAALVPACYPGAVWACNPTVLADITTFTNYQLNAGPHEAGLVGILLGRPLFVTEKLPVLGTIGDILLFDPRMYVLGRRSVEISYSDVPRFFNYQRVFRLLWRGDGQPMPRGTVTLADGSTSAGCFVRLSTS